MFYIELQSFPYITVGVAWSRSRHGGQDIELRQEGARARHALSDPLLQLCLPSTTLSESIRIWTPSVD